MNLYEAYLIMKELLLSVLTVKTEAYFFFFCFFWGCFFLFGSFMCTFVNVIYTEFCISQN